MTDWYHEDEVCWVADCEVCDVPMVVWREHGAKPPDAAVEHMVARLTEAANLRFGADASCARSRITSTRMPAIPTGGTGASRADL